MQKKTLNQIGLCHMLDINLATLIRQRMNPEVGLPAPIKGPKKKLIWNIEDIEEWVEKQINESEY